MSHSMPHHRFRFLFFWLLAVILEAPLFYALFTGDFEITSQNFSQLLTCHLMSAITLFFSYPRGQSWLHHSRNWAVFFFFIVLFLPLFGHLTCFITFILCKNNPETDLLFEEDQIFFKRNRYKSALQNMSFHQSWIDQAKHGVDFVPLVDILEGSDIDLKRGAIEQIIQMPPKDAVELLNKYSSDTSSEVRYYVTSALTRIKKNLEESVEAAKNGYQKNTNDGVSRFTLARSYLQYARSGLLDQSGIQYLTDQAVAHLKFVISNDNQNLDAYQMLYDELFIQQQWQEIDVLLKSMFELSILNREKFLKMKAECHFRLRDFNKLTEDLRELKSLQVNDSDWVATINWLGSAS